MYINIWASGESRSDSLCGWAFLMECEGRVVENKGGASYLLGLPLSKSVVNLIPIIEALSLIKDKKRKIRIWHADSYTRNTLIEKWPSRWKEATKEKMGPAYLWDMWMKFEEEMDIEVMDLPEDGITYDLALIQEKAAIALVEDYYSSNTPSEWNRF